MNSPIQPGRSNRGKAGLAAIVLAAGYSSRMVEFKPLLPLGGITAFERCIDLFRSAGIDEIVVVLGHRASELRLLAERCEVRWTVNPHFNRGMYTSIIAGMRAVAPLAEAAFVLPVDIPLVRATTIRQLATAWAARRARIVYPVFEGRRGHPPLIAREILEEALQPGEKGPLSALLARHESQATEVAVADQAVHLDMDTRADYEALAALAAKREIPTAGECESMLAEWWVDARIVRHSRKVAEVAGRIAAALLRSRLQVNPELVQAGALLHDLAKGQPDHAAAGASILRGMGCDRVAEIVAVHTDLGGFRKLDESAIVYFADKLVRGDELVTLGERFKPALTRFRKDPAALESARRRLAAAKAVAQAVEERVGVPLDRLLRADVEVQAKDRLPVPLQPHEVNMA